MCVYKERERPEEGIRSSVPVIIGSCEPPMWILRTKLWSSVRMAHILNH